MAESIVSKAKVVQELVQLKNWLGRKSDKDSVQHIIDRIDGIAGIDAVPVVRCRECKYRGSDCCPMWHAHYAAWGEYMTRDYTEDDGYCHKGAKEVDHGKETRFNSKPHLR